MDYIIIYKKLDANIVISIAPTSKYPATVGMLRRVSKSSSGAREDAMRRAYWAIEINRRVTVAVNVLNSVSINAIILIERNMRNQLLYGA
jgi:hypothetical protein